MPEMDGLTLLSKLSESNPLIKTVMVSAYGDMENHSYGHESRCL